MLLDENFHEEPTVIQLTTKEVFQKIWTSPRTVFNFINSTGFSKYATLLLVLGGINSALDNASTRGMGDDMPLIGVLALSIILGALLGWISYYIYAALLSWTGKWLGGTSNTTSLVNMLAYALIPSIIGLLLFFPKVGILGQQTFQSDINLAGIGIPAVVLYYFFAIIEFVLAIWSLVILVVGISEFQNISIGKAILNMILPVLIIIVPIMAIAFFAIGFR